jgi:hypothetical protein
LPNGDLWRHAGCHLVLAMLKKKILQLIREKGPLTGSELLEATDEDGLPLWRACRLSPEISVQTVGTRYLRLDRRVKGYARLSPSILREFLTYSVVGLSEDPHSVAFRAQILISHIEEVSRSKAQLAYDVISSLADRFVHGTILSEHACFILAGDIVYNMAHDVSRPERSTGKLVRGSDMDLVVIVDDFFPPELIGLLDETIYQEKYRLFITPHIREEIDYIVKDFNRVREQLRFDTFKHMVACKILEEGAFLFGSQDIFQTLKSLLRDYGLLEKMRAMEKEAQIFRTRAEEFLLREDPEKLGESGSYLFYPVEESEEFE